MEWSSGELRECFEEDGNEGMHILCSVFGRLDSLAVVGVRVPNTNPMSQRQAEHAHKSRFQDIRLI